MSNFAGLKPFFLILSFLVRAKQLVVNRFGLFQKLPGIQLSTKFILRTTSGVDLTKCVKSCYFTKKCVSIAYGNLLCVLYATDPRAQLDESSLIRITNDSPLIMYAISTDFEVPCYGGNIAAYTDSDLEKCGFDEKVIDSNCTDWSSWNSTFEWPCSDKAKILRFKTHARNCTRPLFGGQKGTCHEKWEKTPRLLSDSALSFGTARAICYGPGETVFSGFFC